MDFREMTSPSLDLQAVNLTLIPTHFRFPGSARGFFGVRQNLSFPSSLDWFTRMEIALTLNALYTESLDGLVSRRVCEALLVLSLNSILHLLTEWYRWRQRVFYIYSWLTYSLTYTMSLRDTSRCSTPIVSIHQNNFKIGHFQYCGRLRWRSFFETVLDLHFGL